MGWFTRLFQAKPPVRRNPIAIPIPEDAPPGLFDRVAPPKRSRKKFSPEETEADLKRYQSEMRAKNTAMTAFNRSRAEKIGVTKFVWRTCNDSDVCAECHKLAGRRFSYAKPPKIGLPGEHACEPEGYCRCYAEPVIPDP